MTYRQDDTFDTWPEVYKAGTAAIGLYSRCGVYCARELTDGHIPAELVASYGTREWVQKLVEAGLWEIEGTGYRDVYYLYGKKGNKLNPTREEALANLKAAADRTARWRANANNGGKRGVTRHVQEGDASRDGIRDASSDASPSLPPSKEGKGERAPATPGAARALPEDPRVIAEAEEELRLKAEAAVTAIAEQQRRNTNGAAAVRANIRKPPAPARVNGMAALDAAVAEMALTQPPDPDLPQEQP